MKNKRPKNKRRRKFFFEFIIPQIECRSVYEGTLQYAASFFSNMNIYHLYYFLYLLIYPFMRGHCNYVLVSDIHVNQFPGHSKVVSLLLNVRYRPPLWMECLQHYFLFDIDLGIGKEEADTFSLVVLAGHVKGRSPEYWPYWPRSGGGLLEKR